MKTKNKFVVILILIAFIFLIFPVLSLGAANTNKPLFEYKLLEGIPGLLNKGDIAPDFNEYIGYIYKFLIWIAGICALFMITLGGYMYITSAGNTATLGKAKSIIFDALIGLVLVFTTYLIFNTINPSLLNLPGISSIRKVEFGGEYETFGVYEERVGLSPDESLAVYANGGDVDKEYAAQQELPKNSSVFGQTTVDGFAATTKNGIEEICAAAAASARADQRNCVIVGGTEVWKIDKKTGQKVKAHGENSLHNTGKAVDFRKSPEIIAKVKEMWDRKILKEVCCNGCLGAGVDTGCGNYQEPENTIHIGFY